MLDRDKIGRALLLNVYAHDFKEALYAVMVKHCLSVRSIARMSHMSFLTIKKVLEGKEVSQVSYSKIYKLICELEDKE